MAWITFDSMVKDTRTSKKTGKEYDCYVVRGWKRDFRGGPDESYEKVFFENQPVTVIEKGIERPNQSVVKFFERGVKKGDLVKIKSVNTAGGWRLESVENRSSGGALDYTPLSDEDVMRIKNSMPAVVAAPVATAAPEIPAYAAPMYTPQQAAPITYTMPGSDYVKEYAS